MFSKEKALNFFAEFKQSRLSNNLSKDSSIKNIAKKESIDNNYCSERKDDEQTQMIYNSQQMGF